MMSAEMVKRGIVKTIARSTVSQLLKEAKIKPHLSRYWLNAQPEDPAAFDAQVRAICALHRQATPLHKLGIHLVSTDEKTGIQAWQHQYPAKPVRAGQVARLEHKYDRPGTLCLIANLEVATGRIVAPSVGPRRTGAAFLADPSHRIRFVYTPKPTSWLNQIEIWFSILVGRLLKRASFNSIEELHQALINFIEYFNATMAKPFKWTYAAKP